MPCERFMLHPTRQRRWYLVFHDIVKNRVADSNPDQHGSALISVPGTADLGVKIALLILKRDIFFS